MHAAFVADETWGDTLEPAHNAFPKKRGRKHVGCSRFWSSRSSHIQPVGRPSQAQTFVSSHVSSLGGQPVRPSDPLCSLLKYTKKGYKKLVQVQVIDTTGTWYHAYDVAVVDPSIDLRTEISPTSEDIGYFSHLSALLSLKLPTRILFVGKPS